ncbi:hypothetical protein RM50_04340 [Pseudarthrobacter phenanthrenivorans]|uniref:DNA-binding protein n=2 Tax=Pseudarthrobacter phenanthrenivorans TaxID=361575 RepID=A0A0B4DW68_PSEPS|nr:hypothetical protein RM50_04340 [Pseudarthrobacter phenanthrenivorans]
MTLKEVAEAMGVTEINLRTRMCRKAAGRSAPSFPAPRKKIVGAWFWDRRAVTKFIANQDKASQEGAMAKS